MVNPITFQAPQAFSGGIDWSPLANLGNVAQQAQERQQQQAALSQLTNDPAANAATLIRSGVPSLAQLGISLQSQQQQRAEQLREFNAQQAIREAQERRATETYEEDTPTARVKKLIAQGIDPKDPQWRPWVLTGSNAPDPNKVAKVDTDALTRAERERWALEHKYDPQTAAFYAATGKLPKEDLSATEERMVEDRTKQIHAGEDVMANISRLQELNKTAYSGVGASKRAALLQAVLPDALVPQGAIDTTEYENTALQNVARQAKETFGARLAVAEVKLLNEIETNPLQSPSARKAILDRLQQMFQRHLSDATDEREKIRNKTFFKPGGGAPPSQGATPSQETPAAPAATTPTAKPALKDFMEKARAANPGVPDSELAQYWKKKYGD